jgi:hypothetical protein
MGLIGQRHAPAAPGKDHRYPLDWKLGGPQSLPGQQARGKIFYLCRESNPGFLVTSQALYLLAELP